MAVFAHQGGWDELLMFAIPIALAVLGVRVAEARAKRRRNDHEEPKEEHRERPTG